MTTQAPYNEYADKLIVALDFDLKPESNQSIISALQTRKTIAIAKQLAPLGVILKIGSVVHVEGYSVINKLHELGAKVFVDLKFIDIPNTLERDALLIRNYAPDFVTVMCSVDIDGMERFCQILESQSSPNTTHVVGVSVLTSFDNEECTRVHGLPLEIAVPHLANQARVAGIKYLVASPKDLAIHQKFTKAQRALFYFYAWDSFGRR